MAKAVIMLAMIRKKIEEAEEDCVKFDIKENLLAGRRVRIRLRKTNKMIKKMILDLLQTSEEINKARGNILPKEHWKKYREDGRAAKWNEKSKLYLREKRKKERDAKAAKTKKLSDS